MGQLHPSEPYKAPESENPPSPVPALSATPCSLIHLPTYLSTHSSIQPTIHHPMKTYSLRTCCVPGTLRCRREETQHCCRGVYILWRSQIVLHKPTIKENGGDGRSQSHTKQEAQPLSTCEMGTLARTMVVFFAASNKKKSKYHWIGSFLRADCASFSSGPQ